MGTASSKRQVEEYKSKHKPKSAAPASAATSTPPKAGDAKDIRPTPQAVTATPKKHVKALAIDTKPEVTLSPVEKEKVRRDSSSLAIYVK